MMTPKEAFPKAKAAAIKALELDSRSAKLTTRLHSFRRLRLGLDRREGIPAGHRTDPGYATAHHWYAWHLSLLGRYDEAIAEMRKAENLDPLSLSLTPIWQNFWSCALLRRIHTTEPQDDRNGS